MTGVRAARLALALAAALLPALAQAQTFVLLSQNMLRFGHGSRLSNQCDALTAASAAVDIIVLQEVMTNGYPCLAGNNNKGVSKSVPPNFGYITSPAKGRSSYKEYYGILFRKTPRNNMQITFTNSEYDLSSTASFMRPPFGGLFNVSDATSGKNCNVWIVDIHSIFGKKLSERQGEASAMKTVYAYLTALKQSPGPVIVAGDWNLPADDATGFGWVSQNKAAVEPNVYTSLTSAGNPSSAYDHGLYTSNATTPPTVTFANPAVYTGGMSNSDWRKKVSDHMGVVANVTLTC